MSPIEQSIKNKIERIGTPLKDWNIQINYGIKTGCNEAFIIDEEKRNEILDNCKNAAERKRTDELIRPILRGRDIKRYSYTWANLYLIATFPARHYDIEQYPAVKSFLLSFEKERLENAGRFDLTDSVHLTQFCRQKLEQAGKDIIIDGQPVIVDGKKEKSRKQTGNEWFETQDQIGYWDDFSKQKIVWGNLGLEAGFAEAPQGMFVNAPCPMIVPYNKFLLYVLNSRIGDWYIRQLGVTRNGGYFEYKPMFVQELPVPIVQDQQEKKLIQQLENAKDCSNTVDEIIFSLYHLDETEKNFLMKVSDD